MEVLLGSIPDMFMMFQQATDLQSTNCQGVSAVVEIQRKSKLIKFESRRKKSK